MKLSLDKKVLKRLFSLAYPIFLVNLLQAGYDFIDMFWVGRLGASSVAAVSLSFPVIFFFMSFGLGLSMAGTIMTSQYFGDKNKEMVDFTVGQSTTLSLIVSVILSFFGYLFTSPLIHLMKPSGEVASLAITYLHYSFIGMIFIFGYFSFQGLLRGVGEVKIPMYIVLSTVILDFILDPIFILGYGFIPKCGVGGAALTTIITQFIAFFIGLFIMAKGDVGLKLKLRNMIPNWKFIWKIFLLGLPSSIEMSVRSLSMVTMNFIVVGLGTIITAAYGLGIEILSIAVLPARSLAMATAVLVGQKFGAEKIGEAEEIGRMSSVVSFLLLFILGVLTYIFAKPLSEVFIKNAEVVMQSMTFVRILSFTFGFIAVQNVLNGVFRGSGNTLTSMTLAIISLWVLRLPLAYFLTYATSLKEMGLWYSFLFSNLISFAITEFWFNHGSWKRKRIIKHRVKVY